MISDIDNSNSKVSIINQKSKNVTLGRPGKIKSPKSNLKASLIFNVGNVILTLPIRTISEGNCFEPWQKKHKRHKSQKLQIRFALLPIKTKITLPCRIKLTRYAPRTLDKHDNLPMSFKFITDALCEELTGNYIAGQADSDEQISISYDQEKTSHYGIKIEISF